jgi:hypothetical protein
MRKFVIGCADVRKRIYSENHALRSLSASYGTAVLDATVEEDIRLASRAA